MAIRQSTMEELVSMFGQIYKGIEATFKWYKAWLDRKELISAEQLEAYCDLALSRDLRWMSETSSI